MKKLIIFAIFIFAMCGFTFAQTPREVLDKVKEIKLLESTRNDVRRILVNYESEDPDYEEYYDEFSNDIADIEVLYSNGKCEEKVDDDDDDVAEIWNVAEWKVTKIEITFDEELSPSDLGFVLSEFKKQKVFPDDEDSDRFIYYNKNSGIAFLLHDTVGKIIIYPSKSSNPMLCDIEKAKKFSSGEDWFGTAELTPATHTESVANVKELVLGKKAVTADCGSEKRKDKDSIEKINRIAVNTFAFDPENDVLTYNYTVSAGKIIGQGANVVWDLTGVKPGIYTITAGVDDGCGICGTTRTETITVAECPKSK